MDWLVGYGCVMKLWFINQSPGCWKMMESPGEKCCLNPKSLSTDGICRVFGLFGCQMRLHIETF